MIRVYLCGLLLAMAVGQLANFGGFVSIVEDYRAAPADAARALAAGLTGGEIVAAGLLLSARWRLQGARVAACVAGAWTLLATQATLRGLSIDNCGCFGVHLGQRLSNLILLQDGLFVGTTMWAWRSIAASGKKGRDMNGNRQGETPRAEPGTRTTRFAAVATPTELDAVLTGAGTRVLFLHDPWCPISSRAEVVMYGLGIEANTVDVSTHHELNRLIQERTGVRHESPQVLVLSDGRVRWHASHGRITAAAVLAAIEGETAGQ